MLVIRSEQIRAVFLDLAQKLKPRAVLFLHEAFPEKCEKLGSEAVDNSIEHAFKKAWEYGFEADEEILAYLRLMYALGFEFNEDPSYPWVQEVLNHPQLGPETKIDLLIQRLKLYLLSKGR